MSSIKIRIGNLSSFDEFLMLLRKRPNLENKISGTVFFQAYLPMLHYQGKAIATATSGHRHNFWVLFSTCLELCKETSCQAFSLPFFSCMEIFSQWAKTWPQKMFWCQAVYRRSWYFHSKIVDSLTACLGGKIKTGFSWTQPGREWN